MSTLGAGHSEAIQKIDEKKETAAELFFRVSFMYNAGNWIEVLISILRVSYLILIVFKTLVRGTCMTSLKTILYRRISSHLLISSCRSPVIVLITNVPLLKHFTDVK